MKEKKVTVPYLVLRKTVSFPDIFKMLMEEVLKVFSLKINFSRNLLYVNTFAVVISSVFIIKMAMNIQFQD